MIRKIKRQRSEIISNPCDGKGELRLHHILEKEDLKGKCIMFGKATLSPKSVIGLHAHNDDEEIYYIIRGKGIITDDGVKTEVGPGDAVVTGSGSSHALENIGNDELEFIAAICLLK